MPNKAVQSDNLRGVCIVMSLGLHFTTIQTPHKLRLTAALDFEIQNSRASCMFQGFANLRQEQFMQSLWSGFVKSIDASKLKGFFPVRVVYGSLCQKVFPFNLQRAGLSVKSYSLRQVSCSHYRNVSRCRVASRNSHDIFRFSVVGFCSAVASRSVHMSNFMANLTSRCSATIYALSELACSQARIVCQCGHRINCA